MFCTTCATPRTGDAKYCPTCATPFPVQSSVPTSASQPNGTASQSPSGWDYYVGVLKKYTVFEGRASRAEYWYFVLFNLIILAALSVLETSIWSEYSRKDTGPLTGVYQIAVLVPAIAVGVRRMHDTNRSGWWYIVPIMNFVYTLYAGDAVPNRFGPNPKAQKTV